MFLRDHVLWFLVFIGFQIDSLNALTHSHVKVNQRRHAGPTLELDDYLSYNGIMEYLDRVSEAYVDRVLLNDAGKSFENRTLKTITITNGDGRTGKNVIFLDAAMHSREWITPAAALYVVDQLLGKYEENAHLLMDYDWIIMPLVNPDGYEYSRTKDQWWRNTLSANENSCFGTNLNRNFDTHWKEGYPDLSDPCDDDYAGRKPFSESETVAVRDIMHELVADRRAKMYISLHSYIESIVYPWVYDTVETENHQELEEIAEYGAHAIREAYQTRFKTKSANSFSKIGGTSIDYAYKIGIPLPYVLELSGRNYGFFPPPQYIRLLADESWVGIRAMAKKAIERYPLEDQFNRSAASRKLTICYKFYLFVMNFILVNIGRTVFV